MTAARSAWTWPLRLLWQGHRSPGTKLGDSLVAFALPAKAAH